MIQYAVLVDFSHLFHLAKASALKTPPQYDLQQVTIENVVGKLRTIKKELGDRRIIGYDLVFVEDRPALRKLALLPTYRQGHLDTHLEKEDVKNYLLQNGNHTRFCYSPNNEADDAIASLCSLALASDSTLNLIICTADRDLWQLIGPRVSIFNPIKKEIVTNEDIATAFEWKTSTMPCRPMHIPLIKALWGDSGDCVPNVMPRTQKHLLPIIHQTDGTFEMFKQQMEEQKFYIPSKHYLKYVEQVPNIDRNYQLVKLDNQCELQWE